MYSKDKNIYMKKCESSNSIPLNLSHSINTRLDESRISNISLSLIRRVGHLGRFYMTRLAASKVVSSAIKAAGTAVLVGKLILNVSLVRLTNSQGNLQSGPLTLM